MRPRPIDVGAHRQNTLRAKQVVRPSVANQSSTAGTVAGEADARPVEADTLFNMVSVTKAVLATAPHVLAERGFVDYEAPIARRVSPSGLQRCSGRVPHCCRPGLRWF